MKTTNDLKEQKIAALWKQYDFIKEKAKKSPWEESDRECALIYTRICEIRTSKNSNWIDRLHKIENSFVRGAVFCGGVFLAMTAAAGFVSMIYWAIVILFLITP